MSLPVSSAYASELCQINWMWGAGVDFERPAGDDDDGDGDCEV